MSAVVAKWRKDMYNLVEDTMLLNLPSNLCCYKLDIRERNSSSDRNWLFADIDWTHSNFEHTEICTGGLLWYKAGITQGAGWY